MKNFKAFTLAEVLAVIGIIGVVAALTLPNLSNSTNDMEYVAMLKKTTANLQNAIEVAKDKYGDFATWTKSAANASDRAQIVADRLSDYLIPMKVCGTATGCFSSSVAKAIAGDNGTSFDSIENAYKYILKDGTSLAFVVAENGRTEIYIDLDGPNKGANTVGRDLFGVNFDTNGNISLLPMEALVANNAIAKCRQAADSFACAAWVDAFDNNDYIRCANLSYDGNITCK